jgi:hypothetical protein
VFFDGTGEARKRVGMKRKTPCALIAGLFVSGDADIIVAWICRRHEAIADIGAARKASI